MRTPDQPLARITVTGARLDVVASGSGELAVDAPPGVYEVSATAGGQARLVKVGDEAVTIQLDPPRPVTATPDAGSPHHVDAVGEVSRWPSWEPPAASRIVVVVRLPAGAPTERVVTRFELCTGAGDHLLDVVLAEGSPKGLLVHTAPVPAGSYVLTDLHPPCAGLVVPAWPGWQTVVFLASAGDDVSSALAVMHNVPVDGSWQPDRLADLTDQLHWALTARPTVDLPGLRRIEAAALSAAGPAGVPPIVSLLLARLAIVAGDESAARRHHDELVRHESADPVIPADLDALGGVAVTTGFPPLLARSADDLLGLEARRPGSIVGPAAAFAARLASPLWFRWSATWAADSPIAAPSAFDPRGWERAAAKYLSAGPTSAGTDAFTYVVNDGGVDSAPATVAVTILPELQVDDPTSGEAAQPTLTVKLRVATTCESRSTSRRRRGSELTTPPPVPTSQSCPERSSSSRGCRSSSIRSTWSWTTWRPRAQRPSPFS